ncbi:MAG: hypothetical protein IBX57_00580 [Gammaproteobacteria bacterium]|nr:hypothetical protein [Gammaproteobacteria bacterium]
MNLLDKYKPNLEATECFGIESFTTSSEDWNPFSKIMDKLRKRKEEKNAKKKAELEYKKKVYDVKTAFANILDEVIDKKNLWVHNDDYDSFLHITGKGKYSGFSFELYPTKLIKYKVNKDRLLLETIHASSDSVDGWNGSLDQMLKVLNDENASYEDEQEFYNHGIKITNDIKDSDFFLVFIYEADNDVIKRQDKGYGSAFCLGVNTIEVKQITKAVDDIVSESKKEFDSMKYKSIISA